VFYYPPNLVYLAQLSGIEYAINSKRTMQYVAPSNMAKGYERAVVLSDDSQTINGVWRLVLLTVDYAGSDGTVV
jgi:hypothetical protein